jgi:RimJ/RimL family protein N-acetyltransferase
MEQLRDYIRSFDQTTRLLLGIFDKQTDAHIGMVALTIVDGGRKIVPAMLIGEASYRKIGAVTEIAIAVRGYFFETLGFEAAVVHVLAYNQLAIGMLEHRGWSLIETLPGEKISARTGEKIDLLVYELTRDAWRRIEEHAAQSGEARVR